MNIIRQSLVSPSNTFTMQIVLKRRKHTFESSPATHGVRKIHRILTEEPVTITCLYLLWSFNANDRGNMVKPQSLPANSLHITFPESSSTVYELFHPLNVVKSFHKSPTLQTKRKDTTQRHSHPLVSSLPDRLLFTFPNTPDPPQVRPCEV